MSCVLKWEGVESHPMNTAHISATRVTVGHHAGLWLLIVDGQRFYVEFETLEYVLVNG